MVEINVTRRCVHGCFGIYCGSDAVWRIDGIVHEELKAETEVVFHCGACDGSKCYTDPENECWETEHHAI